MRTLTTDLLIDQVAQSLNKELGKEMSSATVFLSCPMAPPWDDSFRQAIEDLVDHYAEIHHPKPECLTVVLQTNGGYIETVERIVRVTRTNFTEVKYIVPNCAYSAGTVLALSGDDILMDYHSVLGPIDPQYASPNGEYMPGMGYLAKYQELVNTINGAPDANAVRAEIAYLIQKFDPAKLFNIEQAIEHSKSLLKEWLPKHKFKNWTTRSSSGEAVDEAYKQQRAKEIAEILGNATRWHSHGRGITCDDLKGEEIKLKVKNYGDMPELRNAVRKYYDLLTDYMGRRGWQACIHTEQGFRSYI